MLMLGCKGLKTSCNQYMWSIAWIYDCGKCKCLGSIILRSSTLPPWRVFCVHKNWSSVPLVAFLTTKINREQQPHQNIFLKTPLHGRYTQLTCKSETCQALKYDCQFSFHCLQTALTSIIFEVFCILAFKEKRFPWKFKH